MTAATMQEQISRAVDEELQATETVLVTLADTYELLRSLGTTKKRKLRNLKICIDQLKDFHRFLEYEKQHPGEGAEFWGAEGSIH